MTWNIRDWFGGWLRSTWKKLLGDTVHRLTMADGKEGLSWDDIRLTAQFMREAENKIPTGEERREWVIEQIKRLVGTHKTEIVELLFWVSLNYAKVKGWVQLGSGLEKLKDFVLDD